MRLRSNDAAKAERSSTERRPSPKGDRRGKVCFRVGVGRRGAAARADRGAAARARARAAWVNPRRSA